MKALLPIALALLTAACAAQRPLRTASPPIPTAQRLVILQVEGSSRYIIDPRSETCFLVWISMEEVSCEALKRNYPPAADAIAWIPEAAPAPPASAHDATRAPANTAL